MAGRTPRYHERGSENPARDTVTPGRQVAYRPYVVTPDLSRRRPTKPAWQRTGSATTVGRGTWRTAGRPMRSRRASCERPAGPRSPRSPRILGGHPADVSTISAEGTRSPLTSMVRAERKPTVEPGSRAASLRRHAHACGSGLPLLQVAAVSAVGPSSRGLVHGPSHAFAGNADTQSFLMRLKPNDHQAG